jgi:gliding motility-associated-like protein
MIKHYFVFVFLFFTFNLSFAQKEASHWFFGENAGLDFTSGSPVADTNGSLNTLEGCTTISDVAGNLLFYTDGTTVWNQNHVVMPTGNGLFGDPSSSQSAIIVPKPGDNNIYYIFTVDWSGGSNGLNYYTVDMMLDGGLGDVIGVNNVPNPILLLTSPISEKITAVKVFNEEAFWVISYQNGRFFVFKVDNNGVNQAPIAGNEGFSGSGDARGYLKTSPDGTKLVSANMTTGLFLYDFDDVTGTVSNERQLNVLGEFSYGVEFSPLSKKLYISTGNFGGNGLVTEKLFQFTVDIPVPTSENLDATRVELHSYLNARAALQVGLDGKIYRAIDGTNSLGIINNPDGDGTAADYQHGAISLGGQNSTQGLPPFIQSFFAALIQIENQCLGDISVFTIESNEPIISIIWDFGDGSATSTLLSPTHTYALPGEYTLTVQVTTADETKTITQTITIFVLPNITTPITLQQCDDDTDGISAFNLREIETLLTNDDPTPTFTYHLSQADADTNTGAIANLLAFSNATASQVFVRVENQFGCYDIATVNLRVSITDAVMANLMLNFNECDTDLIDGDDANGITTFDFSSATNTIMNLFPANQNVIVSYYENTTDALAEENAIDATSYRNENAPFTQQIVVRVDNQDNNACLGLGFHITLIVESLPEFDLVDEQILCLNQLSEPITLMVENPQDDYTYEWRDQGGVLLSTSATSSLFEVTTAGDYFVTAISVANCETTKKITVTASNIAIITSIDVVDVSVNNTITVNVTGEGDYEFALDDINSVYQDSNLFENVIGGIHIVYVRDKNGCGTISEEVSVISFPKFFTPNGDGFNDTWQVSGVGFQPASKIYIFDRFGKVIAKIDASNEGWDGKYRGNQMPSSDYWFKVELEDGRLLKGHFSLIRR